MPPKVDAHIARLPASIPFVAPERTERETGQAFVARIGANEGNFGCSPLATEAMIRASHDHIGNYCDPECYALREAICEKLSLAMDNVVAGPGIDGLLGLIVRIFSAAGDDILTSLGAYPTFNFHVAGYDRNLQSVPYRNDREDLAALSEKARQIEPAIIYLSNPDNPMGTYWSGTAISEFIASLPEKSLLVLDEAYGETAPQDTLPLLNLQQPNVLRLRTFSKAYGMAGLRCGYAIGHRELIAPFEKVRDHFGVNMMAQVGAKAALFDDEWLAENLQKIATARNRITGIAKRHGLQPIVSAANFVTIDCGADGQHAMNVLQGLMARGIFVRKPMAPVLDRCIRISAGRPEELDAFDAALTETLRASAD